MVWRLLSTYFQPRSLHLFLLILFMNQYLSSLIIFEHLFITPFNFPVPESAFEINIKIKQKSFLQHKSAVFTLASWYFYLSGIFIYYLSVFPKRLFYFCPKSSNFNRTLYCYLPLSQFSGIADFLLRLFLLVLLLLKQKAISKSYTHYFLNQLEKIFFSWHITIFPRILSVTLPRNMI